MSDGAPESFKIEWLTSFLSVVDYGGFAAAAENTYRSQPRISAHIADLERRLGAMLFDRKERPVRLTEAGLAYLEYARRVISDLGAGEASVQAVIGLLRGRVRLGCYPSAGAAFAAHVLKEFAAAHPAVTVALHEGSTLELSDALSAGEADVAIRPLLPMPRESNLKHHPLWEEPLVALVPEEHALAADEYLSLARLAEYPLVTIGTNRGDAEGQHEAHQALAAARVSPIIAATTNEPQTLVSFVRENIGVGLTNLLAAEVSDTHGVRVIPIQDSGNRRRVGVFWDSARALQPAARALLDTIVELPVPQAVQRYQRLA